MDFAVCCYGGKLLCFFNGNYFERDHVRGFCDYAGISFKEDKIIHTDKFLLHSKCCFSGNLSFHALKEENYGTISKNCSMFPAI